MKLYNTLTRNNDELEPIHDSEVKIYTCGLTVYSQPHIGNWVGYIYWDVLVRTLKNAGYDVRRVQNITDVGHLVSDDDEGEDKMEKGARTEGITAWDVAEKYSAIANDEARKLSLLKPDITARATDYIPQQIEFVKLLESKGFTYVIDQEGVYFDTSKLDSYGALARLDKDGLQAGARVAIDGKKNPTDFALWKCSPTDKKRDMEWDSPWGKGFPGWHLECSVIARETLGDQIDIHTGGIDHIPVHHTNEIAQTESITGKRFASIWLHNNHLKVDGQKMSKSLGNIYTLQDISDKGYDLQAFKLMVLSKHYSTEGNFTWENLDAANNVLSSLKTWADLQYQNDTSDALASYYNTALENIRDALQNNLNTHEAITNINDMRSKIDELGADSNAIAVAVREIEQLLGLTLSRGDITHEQKELIEARATAREQKNWEESDRIREKLKAQGLAIKDHDSFQRWSRL